ncbi:MAG: 50S ribosomal protein L25 [bacterium]|nr:50S ribosomal protein L25 [bacterium]
MTATVLDAKPRTEKGKNKVKHLRNEGIIPAVVYGGSAEPEMVSVELRILEMLYNRSPYGRNQIIDLSIDGKQTQVISKDFGRHPVTGRIKHVDFYRVQEGKTVAINVPVRLSGTAVGQKMGGVLLQGLTAIKIECQPSAIPEFVAADVSGMKLGDVLQVKDLKLDGINVKSMRYEIIATVDVPRAEKAAGSTEDSVPVNNAAASEDEDGESGDE